MANAKTTTLTFSIKPDFKEALRTTEHEPDPSKGNGHSPHGTGH